MAGKGIYPDLRFLIRGHVRQLSFLVVGDDPHMRQGRERGDLGPGPDVLAGFDLTLADDAVLGRDDAGVGQIQGTDLEMCALTADRSLDLRLLRGEYPELLHRGVGLRAVLRQLRGELSTGGV